MPSFETAARSLRVEPIIAPVRSDEEMETAIRDIGREPGGGLVVMPDVFMNVHRSAIISAAARNNVPAVYYQSAFARDGGLLSYGVDGVDIWRRAASYVDRVLRGEMPGDLPVQFPTKFEMVVNRKTADGARAYCAPIDHAARHRGHRITASYVGLWHRAGKPEPPLPRQLSRSSRRQHDVTRRG